MTESKDNGGGPLDAETEYRVGNKHPPLHSRFKRGKSGNPKGRPKGRPNFGKTLLDEFYKKVPATMNGKPVKVGNHQVFIASLFKDAITKGPQAKALLLKCLASEEAHIAAAEAAKKADKSASPAAFSWTEEQERLYQELEELTQAEEKMNDGEAEKKPDDS